MAAAKTVSSGVTKGAGHGGGPGAGVPRAVARFVTTRTALVLGFGVLLALLLLSGFNAVQALSELQSNNETTLREFLDNSRELSEIRSAVYLSGTYIRDYLLEPDATRAEQSRSALIDTRRRIESILAGPAARSRLSDERMYTSLKQEIQDYWRTMDPVLAWDALQRRKQGYAFLRDQVLPHRASALRIADTIGAVNREALLQRDHNLLGMFSSLRNRTILAVVLMFLFGFLQASANTVHVLGLERQTVRHLAEMTAAREELRHLSAKLVDAQESERKNISRDLHDAVGQSLSAVQLELHDLAGVLAPYPDVLRTRVDRIRELVESSATMVRNVALLLRPSMLDDLGLKEALEWHARQIARSAGLKIDVFADRLPQELPEDHKTCIFRLVQEALNNVCKHSNADSVAIHMRSEEGEIAVSVRDNGRGFTVKPGKGLGLVGMQERIDGLGGRLAIQSEPGRGTLIEAWLPLPHCFSRNRDPGPAFSNSGRGAN